MRTPQNEYRETKITQLKEKLTASTVPQWIVDSIITGTRGQSTANGMVWEMLVVANWGNVPDSGYIVTADKTIHSFGDVRKRDELEFVGSRWEKNQFDPKSYASRNQNEMRSTQ